VWDLEVVSLDAPTLEESKNDPADRENAFICHLEDHWFCIRKVNGEWYNFNSLYPAPEHLSKFYLSAYLDSLKASGWTIFTVKGYSLSCFFLVFYLLDPFSFRCCFLILFICFCKSNFSCFGLALYVKQNLSCIFFAYPNLFGIKGFVVVSCIFFAFLQNQIGGRCYSLCLSASGVILCKLFCSNSLYYWNSICFF
jgi:Josephin